LTKLSVNVNKIAWLRNARTGDIPNIKMCAEWILSAGAHGITVHPRPDMRHIRPLDVGILADTVKSYPSAELNIEGNPNTGPADNGYPGFLKLVEDNRPNQVTLVPDSEGQLTSDHGWDLSKAESRKTLTDYVDTCHQIGARVSLFVDPVITQIDCVPETGADRIELYTGPYAECVLAYGTHHPRTKECWINYQKCTQTAVALGLKVNAGHDLNLDNLPLFNSIGELAEVSIGHALISDALRYGLEQTVYRYLKAINHISK